MAFKDEGQAIRSTLQKYQQTLNEAGVEPGHGQNSASAYLARNVSLTASGHFHTRPFFSTSTRNLQQTPRQPFAS